MDVELGLQVRFVPPDYNIEFLRKPRYCKGTDTLYQALAPHVSNIVGVDEDETMTPVYNEIATRLGHATCTMQAYTGNIMPDQPYEIKGFPTSETFGDFDLVVVVVSHDVPSLLIATHHL